MRQLSRSSKLCVITAIFLLASKGALQGRFENNFITLNKGEWNSRFLDQLFQFPDPLTHDDLVDALAYIDQVANVAYDYDYEIEDHEILDVLAGY